MRLETLCSKVKCDAVMRGEVPEGWPEGTSPWRVTLRYAGRRLTVPFYTGPLAGSPDAAGVLDCILSDANSPEDFADFCSEYGYDEDSRKAERIHRACRALAPKVQRLLGDDYETFLYADR